MIIHLERTGGFTAIPQQTVIDLASLDSSEGQMLRALVESADFFKLPGRIPSARDGVDRFHYKLTIEEVDRRHTVEMGESGVPEQLRPLLQQLTLLARRSRKVSNQDQGKGLPKTRV